MEQTKYDVFISYSRKDYVDEQKNVIPDNEVSKIKEALTKAGITYWFDEEGVYSGQNFVEKIVNNIEQSQIFVFLSTKNANESHWTCKEIASADEFGKPIIPVRIDKSPYNKKVLFRISDLNYIEYYVNPDKGISDLIDAVNVHLKQIEEDRRRKEEEQIHKIEAEKKKAEELKRQKELEERLRQEEQERIVSEVKLANTTLNNEEAKLEIDRENLLLKTEGIADVNLRDIMKSQIRDGGVIHQKHKEEYSILIKEKEETLEQILTNLKHSQDKIEEQKVMINRLREELKSSEKKRGEILEDRCATVRGKRLYSIYIPLFVTLAFSLFIVILYGNNVFGVQGYYSKYIISYKIACIYGIMMSIYYLILLKGSIKTSK